MWPFKHKHDFQLISIHPGKTETVIFETGGSMSSFPMYWIYYCDCGEFIIRGFKDRASLTGNILEENRQKIKFGEISLKDYLMRHIPDIDKKSYKAQKPKQQ